MRALAVAVAALVLVPTASAWTKINGAPVQNTMHGDGIRTAAGTELFAYSDGNSSLRVWSSKGGDREIARVPFVSEPALVQQPNGAIQLYVGAASGVVRVTSSDDGGSWTGPVQTGSTKTGPVESAAVRRDGTPLFAQDSTAGIVVYQGLNGEQAHTVFAACCGYAESLAVDTNDYAQVAFWSNASALPSLFVYEGLDGGGAQAGPGRAFGQPQTVSHDDDVPLVADGLGNTFMGWAGGYPTSSSFVVNHFQGGNLLTSTIAGGGSFSGGDPHIALAVDPPNRLWALWTQGGAVHARRSRSAAAHLGAPTVAGLGGATAYQLGAIALPDGRVDAFVNVGDSIEHQVLLPGLTISATKKIATVLDDGFGVAGAVLRGGGRAAKTKTAGKASLASFKSGTRITVGASGYANASFKKP